MNDSPHAGSATQKYTLHCNDCDAEFLVLAPAGCTYSSQTLKHLGEQAGWLLWGRWFCPAHKGQAMTAEQRKTFGTPEVP